MNLVLTIQRKHQQDKNMQQAREMYLFKHPGTGSVCLMRANAQGRTRFVCHFPTAEIEKIGRALYFYFALNGQNLMNSAKSGQMARLLLVLARGSRPRPCKALRTPF